MIVLFIIGVVMCLGSAIYLVLRVSNLEELEISLETKGIDPEVVPVPAWHKLRLKYSLGVAGVFIGAFLMILGM